MEQKVYEYLTRIPVGQVATYGQIAAWLGNPHLCRWVGNVLHRNPDPAKYPCHRVVNSRGMLSARFAFGGLAGQRQKLQSEGVEVTDGRVDLQKYQMRDILPATRP